MRFTVLLVGLTLTLGGCGAFGSLASGTSSPFSGLGGIRGDRTEINGMFFRTKTRSASADDRAFTTSTAGAARSLTAAAEAGRQRASEYCIRRFGGSDIIWTRGPDREPENMAIADGGALVLAGSCVTR